MMPFWIFYGKTLIQNHTHSRLTAFFSRTTWVGRYQKDKPFWILLKQEMTGWQWHQPNHMQIVCTLLQTDNHASTASLHIFLLAGCPSCCPTNSVKAQKAVSALKADKALKEDPHTTAKFAKVCGYKQELIFEAVLCFYCIKWLVWVGFASCITWGWSCVSLCNTCLLYTSDAADE